MLNMDLLVLITLYKCVHAYLENIKDRMDKDVLLWQSNQFWIAQPTLLHTNLFLHTALNICPKYHASVTQPACAAL